MYLIVDYCNDGKEGPRRKASSISTQLSNCINQSLSESSSELSELSRDVNFARTASAPETETPGPGSTCRGRPIRSMQDKITADCETLPRRI